MLSMMAKGFYTDSPLIFFPVLALGIFIVTFTFITIRTLRSSNEALEHAAALPLGDDVFATSDTSEKDHENE